MNAFFLTLYYLSWYDYWHEEESFLVTHTKTAKKIINPFIQNESKYIPGSEDFHPSHIDLHDPEKNKPRPNQDFYFHLY
jgi:hypothetical protein